MPTASTTATASTSTPTRRRKATSTSMNTGLIDEGKPELPFTWYDAPTVESVYDTDYDTVESPSATPNDIWYRETRAARRHTLID
mgnify:FL=1